MSIELENEIQELKANVKSLMNKVKAQDATINRLYEDFTIVDCRLGEIECCGVEPKVYDFRDTYIMFAQPINKD